MGRPPIGKRAMTGAERQQRYIDRLVRDMPAAREAAAKAFVAEKEKGYIEALKNRDREIAALKARIAELQRRGAGPQLTRSHRREAGEVEFSETGKLRAEIGKLKSDIIKLKTMLQEEPDAAKLRKKVVDQQVEMASLRRAFKQTAKERDQYKARTRLKYREAARLLIPKNHSIIVKALHSDRLKQCSADELKEAERVAVALRPLFDEYKV